jgi:RimJ/RimL family protein N-acetyltransferase
MTNSPEITVKSPFPVYELPRVWLWSVPVLNRVSDDNSPKTMEAFVEQQMQMADNAITWGVYRDGILGGFIRYDPIDEVSGFAHAIFDKGTGRDNSFFGRKTTVPAITAVAQKLFSIGVQQIIMLPFESNNALIALLLHIGAKKRALLYNAATQGGEPVNMVQMTLSPDDLQREVAQCR